MKDFRESAVFRLIGTDAGALLSTTTAFQVGWIFLVAAQIGVVRRFEWKCFPFISSCPTYASRILPSSCRYMYVSLSCSYYSRVDMLTKSTKSTKYFSRLTNL